MLFRILDVTRGQAGSPIAIGVLACAWLAAFPQWAAAHSADAIGGGFADSGIEGAYYPNAELSGTPAFTRRDVRIDFDWGEMRLIGGSTAEPYRSFPRDGFSVRWTGRIVPRFNEAYTFLGDADDGIRIKVRGPGEAKWSTVVDRWDAAGPFESSPIQLLAGKLYEIQVEYRELSGAARCKLEWRSKSTPREIIDPVTQQALNATPFVNFVWADQMKTARFDPEKDPVDAGGWPTKNGAELIMTEMGEDDVEMRGTYLFRFRGRAQVRQSCCGNPSFRAGDAQFTDALPLQAGYDRATNTTSSLMTVNTSRTFLVFEQTARTPNSRGNGVTHIQLMRPLAPGSARHHAADEIVYRPFKSVLQENYTAVRWLEGANWETESDWSERTLPGSAAFHGPSGQENWEYLIMLANETGKDLYITTPLAANDAYFDKLALLFRYGSDGREPYKTDEAKPKYPPLNPNLRVYVEVGNEIWNWIFGSTQLTQRRSVAEAEQDTATWAAMNYDGQAGGPEGMLAMRRWHALRTVYVSNAFRKAWGDAAMGPHVRIMLEYQYNNFQDTAASSLFFIDEYFHARAAERGADPHPVSYYIWGAGGATYYGLANGAGEQGSIVFKDASFERPALTADSRKFRPEGTAWTFRGRSGVIRPAGASPIGELQNPSKPKDGEQAGFVFAGGSFAQRVQFTKPGYYAIAFNAAGSGVEWPGHLPFDIYIDDRKISPYAQDDIRVASGYWLLGGWARDVDNLEEEWGSAVFEIAKAGPHTIRFVGRSDGDGYTLFDNIRIASVDAVMTGGFDAGEAEGQVGEANIEQQFRSQATYARAFGLQVVAYEAGWSVGGDFHQTPLQTWCKLKDDRAKAINDRVIKLWDESGSFMNVWGVYRYWPNYDFANARSYPIMRSYRDSSAKLRAEPTYGQRLPAVLNVDDADWMMASGGGSGSWWRQFVPCEEGAERQWFAWMLIAPKTGTYTVQPRGEGSGSLSIEIDGEVVGEYETMAQPITPLRVQLTQGAHAIRAVREGECELRSIEISR